MVSINGFNLRKVTIYKGHEGEPLEQASIYLNNTEIGYYSQGDWGGLSTLEFKDSKQRDIFIQTSNRWLDKYPNGIIPDEFDMRSLYRDDPEGLILELLTLKEIEKAAKKAMRKVPNSAYILFKGQGNKLYEKLILNKDDAILDFISKNKAVFLVRSDKSFELTI